MFGAIKSAMGIKRPMQPAQPPAQPPSAGIGPSNPMMSKLGMMGQKMQQPNPMMNAGAAMGAVFGGGRNMQRPQPLPEQPPPMMAPPSEPIGDAGIGQNLNPNPVEAPIPQQGAPMGLGPSPRMMPRRPMMNPRMRQPMM